MLVIGLTGGIGAGKSTVSAMLRRRGAIVVDTDEVSRRVVEPGGPAHRAVVDRFGAGVVGEAGGIDRSALAALVFTDPAALADLNAIVHPAVREVVEGCLATEARTDHVVVLDIPLLVESAGAYPTDGVVVVDCPPDLAVRRLVGLRGMDESDALRRVAAQASREERLAHADFVILNDATVRDLETQVDAAWTWICSLAPGPRMS